MNINFGLEKWTPQAVVMVLVVASVFGLVIYLSIVGQPLPTWLSAALSFILGGGVFSVGHTAGAKTVMTAQTTAANGAHTT